MRARSSRRPLDDEALRAALAGIVADHDAMRYAAVRGAEHDPTDPASWWAAYALERRDGVEVDVVRHPSIDAFPAPRAFAPDDPPLVRLDVAPFDGGEAIRVANSHVTFDAISSELFWAELGRRCVGRDVTGTSGAPVAAYPEAFAEQHEAWASGAWAASRDYWTEHLRGLDANTLPPESRKLTIWPLRKHVAFELDEAELDAFERFRQEARVTKFAAAVALFGLALRAVVGWRRPGVVVPVANRSKESREQIGMFANLVYLAFDADDLAGAGASVRAALVQTFRHGHYPLFLLGAEVPEVGAVLANVPRVAVRDPVPDLGSAGAGDAFDVIDDGDEGAAPDYGLGADLLADFYLRPSSVKVRLSYRADKLHHDTVVDLAAAFRAGLA